MKKLLSLLIITAISISCSSSSIGDQLKSDLNGSWNMTSYNAAMPESQAISEGTIVWTFNMNKKTLTIYQAPELSFRYLEKAVYRITGDENSINLDNANKYNYRFEDGNLILDANIDGATDMPIITFRR